MKRRDFLRGLIGALGAALCLRQTPKAEPYEDFNSMEEFIEGLDDASDEALRNFEDSLPVVSIGTSGNSIVTDCVWITSAGINVNSYPPNAFITQGGFSGSIVMTGNGQALVQPMTAGQWAKMVEGEKL